jgi:iron complex outermembrane receptor protein
MFRRKTHHLGRKLGHFFSPNARRGVRPYPLFMKLFRLLACWLLTDSALAQTPTGTVRGHIQAASGESLLGISVGLEGTGLGAPTDTRGDFTIKQVPAGTYALVATGLGYKATKQNVTVTAGRPTTLRLQLTENQQELTEVVVTGTADLHRYAEPVSELGTRTSARLLDVPQAIQAVPQQVLRDQQAQTLTEALHNVAGVTTYSGYMDYVLRGFRTNFINGANFTTNGVRGVFYDFSQVPPLYNVERIEVIKGPASVLFSAAAPGGVINTVTKQPLAHAEYAASFTYGSFGQRRATADATGPLAAGGRLRYRAIVGYEKANSFRDYQHDENMYLAPSLSYVGEHAQVTAEVNYQADNATIGYDRGLVATTRADGSYNFDAVPLSWSRNDPSDHTTRRSLSAQLDYRQQFGGRTSLRSLLRYSQYHFRNFQYDSYGPPVNDSITDRLYEVYPIDFYSLNSNTFLTTQLQTGPVQHTLVAGFDVGVYRNPYAYNIYAAPSISLYNPDRSFDNPATFPLTYQINVRDRNVVLGGYLQDQLALGEHWKALLALRYDTYRYVVNFDQRVPPATEQRITENTALLPRVGLVYQPTATTSLYASFTESFNPQADNYTLGIRGGPFKPEKGVQYEVGAKQEWAGGRVVSTLAAYQITKTNVLVPDPTDPLGLRQNSRGEARSRGVELTLQGQLTTNLSTVANYAYNQAIITQDNNPDNVGNGLPNAPRHVGNAWLKYTASRGPLRGLGLGGGGNFSSRKVIEGPQDLKLPGYVSYEATVSYAYGGATLALNAYNLANTHNFSGGYSQGVLYVQPPRSFRLQLSYCFQPKAE